MAKLPYSATLNGGLAVMVQQTPVKVDAAIVGGAFTSPWWLPYVEHALSTGASALMWIAGFVLVAIRIAIAYRDWRRGK